MVSCRSEASARFCSEDDLEHGVAGPGQPPENDAGEAARAVGPVDGAFDGMGDAGLVERALEGSLHVGPVVGREVIEQVLPGQPVGRGLEEGRGLLIGIDDALPGVDQQPDREGLEDGAHALLGIDERLLGEPSLVEPEGFVSEKIETRSQLHHALTLFRLSGGKTHLARLGCRDLT